MDALLIPRELASEHFPPLLNRYTYAERIQITEPEEGLSSDATVGFLGEENAFVIANDWWKEYVNRKGLRPLDAIRFYRQVPAAPNNHFVVDFIAFYWCRNNEWPVTITILVPTPTTVHHMMPLSDKFVTENNLKVGDLIEFYKPVRPLHSRHFLIKVAEGAGQMYELGQGSGSAAKDGDGDGDNDGDGTGGGGNRKGNEKGISGRNKRQGDGGSSGVRRKGQKTRSVKKIYSAK
ncbi:hypothetical protein C3L33_07270, partial [Rhododendron williamsianum]